MQSMAASSSHLLAGLAPFLQEGVNIQFINLSKFRVFVIMAIASTQSSSSSCIINNHHYALDAAKLVDKCRIALRSILRHIDERSESAKDTATATSATASTTTPRRHRRVARELLALDDALNCADRLVHAHLLDLLDREMEYLSSAPRRNGGGGASDHAADEERGSVLHDFFGEHVRYPTLHDTIGTLAHAERTSRECRLRVAASTATSSTTTTTSSRGMKDSSLFRLIVALQLCLVRLDEANSVLCHGKAGGSSSSSNNSNGGEEDLSSSSSSEQRRWMTNHITTGVGLLSLGGAAAVVILISKSEQRDASFKLVGNVTLGMATASCIRKRWRIFCINARIADTAAATEDWIFNWICLVNDNDNNNKPSSYISMTDDAARQQRQLRAISRSSRSKNLWYSNGRIRFRLIKRGMDLWYATVGKAVELTNGGREISDPSWNQRTVWTYVVAYLAASYYNCVGPSAASALAVANSPSSVIQEAWGVVSMPAVKRASLEATRILKGAAIADRVDICGVSCFVLSREPIPALSLALRRYRRRREREGGRLLDTILERTSSSRQSSLARDDIKGFQKHNVILHLTGGGFFAHTIAGDLPYLLDWSASSKAVIIVPEYSLAPRKYPDAITEIIQIYSALRYGQATAILGFQPDRIIVSGESVGGNLATALCVSLIMNHNDMGHCVQELTHEESFEMVSDLEDSENEEQTRVNSSSSSYIGLDTPDALLLCCPALNLSLEPSPSRIHGAHDPVLPSALFSTISTSYLGGCSPTDPVASPYFASDATICSFPTTLIFTSSDDPLLDDSVSFNGRLRSVGVSSRLRAVHDMPHAFWALSTAGIPEARQVQKECQRFISKMFHSSSDEVEVFD